MQTAGSHLNSGEGSRLPPLHLSPPTDLGPEATDGGRVPHSSGAAFTIIEQFNMVITQLQAAGDSGGVGISRSTTRSPKARSERGGVDVGCREEDVGPKAHHSDFDDD